MSRDAPRRSLLGATAVVSGNTLVSRVLGFARDVILARVFGASPEADAFFVAFRIPNLFRRLFAEGAFSQAFVPVLSQWRSDGGDEAVRDLLRHVAGVLALILVVVTIIGMLAAPVLIAAFAPGFEVGGAKHALSVELLRLCFPYLAFISLTSLCAGVLNTYGQFGVPAFTPVLLNVCLIAAAIWLAPQFEEPIVALAIGVLVAGVAQLALQLPFLLRIGMLVRPAVSFTHPGVRRIGVLVVPALLGVSVAQLNILIGTIIASFLEDGSVTWLYFADRMMEFPLGVFGIALATVILPSLSRDHGAGAAEGFTRTLDWALRLVLVITVPCALGLSLLALPIMSTLFGHGAFDDDDVRNAGLALVAFAPGLPGFVAVKVLAPGFFARQEMKTPVKVAALAVGVNLALALALVGPLAHVGLAFATSMAALVNAAVLWVLLVRHGVFRRQPGWALLLLRVLIANAVMAAVVLSLDPGIGAFAALTSGARAVELLMLISAGALSYLLTLIVLGVRPRALLAPQRG